ncbi:MAG: ATP-binding cassette domain-containing protein [Mesorhizobium sp.]|nr:MAG: ATP-binding cassette domain-containing protein [Mesorhizobium sp.]
MTEAVIVLKDVSLTLGEGASSVHVLKGVSLDVAAGEATGIVGPSGSGKSTLLMVLAGLERVDSGTVRIAGELLNGKSEDQIASFRGRNIGIVFQSFHLIPNMTALENVAVPLELAGHADPFGVAARELAAVGLSDRVTHYPGELSGGEQQRVAIARALTFNPKLVIMDEPTAALAVREVQSVLDLIRRLRSEGIAVILISHRLNDVLSVTDRIVVLRHGRADADLVTSKTNMNEVVSRIVGGGDVSAAAAHEQRG